MQRHLLLAVDDSISSKNAIQYVVRISSLVKDISYTLIHIQPPISLFLEDEAKTSIKAQMAIEKIKEKNAKHAKEILEKCKTRMTEMGVAADRIQVYTQPRKSGIAKDVIEIAEEKQFDAIVVGRRGLSKIQEVFMGSFTNKLVEHSKYIPVWIVDGDVTSNRILLALDGSESSLRAVDHFCFIAANNPDIKATLFHANPRFQDYCMIDFNENDQELEEIVFQVEQKSIDHFMSKVRKLFRESNIQDSQIEIKQVKCIGNPGKAIIEESIKGKYGTVVVGRRGTSRSFFMGSVSHYVLEKICDRALWLVP